jgi:prevent-host-death family protein
MPVIRPITELRKTNEISDFCHKTEEPVFITKNGYGDMVIMSIETWERDHAAQHIIRKLEESERDLANGVKPLGSNEFLTKMRAKYGYKPL